MRCSAVCGVRSGFCVILERVGVKKKPRKRTSRRRMVAQFILAVLRSVLLKVLWSITLGGVVIDDFGGIKER